MKSIVIFLFTITAISFGDYLINAEISPNAFNHATPQVATNNSGISLIAWIDNREGVGRIYFQLYDSLGNLTGSNISVPSADYHYSPHVAALNTGNFVISYVKETDNNLDIFAAIYAPDGSLIKSPFKINDDLTEKKQLFPKIIPAPNSDFVITWVDYRNGSWAPDIYLQYFDSLGNQYGNNIIAHSNLASDQTQPAGCFDWDMELVILWVNNKDIYAQAFYNYGIPCGPSVKINDDSIRCHYYPSAALRNDNKILVVWQEQGIDSSKIYGQIIDVNGCITKQGINYQIISSGRPKVPSLFNFIGGFGIIFQDSLIWLQRCDTLGNPSGAPIQISDTQNSQKKPSISGRDDGSFISTWQEIRENCREIFYRIYTSLWNPVGPSNKSNDEPLGADQILPSVAANDLNYYFLWQDFKNGDSDIFLRITDTNFFWISPEICLVADTSYRPQIAPAVDFDSIGIGVWMDSRLNSWHICGQLFSENGTPIGLNFQIDNDSGYIQKSSPDIAINKNFGFAAVWLNCENRNIYTQRYNLNGSPIDTNLLVNDEISTTGCRNPAVSLASNGNLIITWESETNIFCRILNFNSGTGNSEFQVNEPFGALHFSPSVGCDSAGNFVVVWYDDRRTTFGLYGQRFDSTGAPLGSNFAIDNDNISVESPAAVSMSIDGKFIVAWSEIILFEPTRIVARGYDADGLPMGEKIIVSNETGLGFQKFPDVFASQDDKLIFCWMENRLPGYNIYAISHLWEEMVILEYSDFAETFEMLSTQPNPFRDRIDITYIAGHKAGDIELKIYDATGCLVKEFNNLKNQQSSVNQIRWEGEDKNGNSVPAGVYFITFKENRKVSIEKIVKIK